MSLTMEKVFPLSASLLLHAAVLVALLFIYLPKPEPEPESQVPIQIHAMRAPELPAPAPAPAPPAPEPNVRRTSVNPTEKVEPEIASSQPENEPQKTEPEPAPSSPPETTVKSPKTAAFADAQTLEQMRRELEKSKAEQQKRESELLDQIAHMTDKAPGAKRSYTTRGTDRGTVRELNIEHYPVSMQHRFMSRYGIKIRTKYVEGGGNQSYINAAKTERGTYLNRGGRGYFEVMTLTPAVIKRMAELEMAELKKRGLDPLRTEIITVEFGLKEDANGLVDLVVTRFDARPVD